MWKVRGLIHTQNHENFSEISLHKTCLNQGKVPKSAKDCTLTFFLFLNNVSLSATKETQFSAEEF